MITPLTHVDLFPLILEYLSDGDLIKKARVSKKWHAKIQEILKGRNSLECRIASSLHNRRWSKTELKNGSFPCKIAGKQDGFLYVAYTNARVYRWNLKTQETDKVYPIAYDPYKLKIKGNFLLCYGSFNHLHFTHLDTLKTIVKIGNYYNAWKDWVIYLTFHIGLYHYETKETHVLHFNVTPSSRIVSVIDNKLVTYNKGVIYLWDLIGKAILLERPFFGIFFTMKLRDEVMIWHLMRNRNGSRFVAYKSLESSFKDALPIHRNVLILRSQQPKLFTLDQSQHLLTCDKISVQADKHFKSHGKKIYKYGPFIIMEDARVYRIVQGSLKLVKEHRGYFFPDGTLAVLKKDKVVVLGLNQEALQPLKAQGSLLRKFANRIKF